jgi:secreted Zn-dependent insulinase-like peptidase
MSSNQTVITSNYLEGILEHVGGMELLFAYFIESGCTGVLQVNGSSMHLERGVITHIEHLRLHGMSAAVEVIQRKTGYFKFVKQAITRSLFLNASAVMLEAMRLQDEARRFQYNEIVVPDISAALVCAQSIAPFTAWSVYETDYQNQNTTIMALHNAKIIVLSGNTKELRRALFQQGMVQELQSTSSQSTCA